MLKVDLHVHVEGDSIHSLPYTAKHVIDRAALENFHVLSFTCHDIVLFSPELETYAAAKGIRLIPGVERTIQGKHVLIYNLTQADMENIISFDALRSMKQQKKIIIGAPHPFFPFKNCLGNLLLKHINLFDFIEFSPWYCRLIDCNKKALMVAKKYGKPVYASSDCHDMKRFGTIFTTTDKLFSGNTQLHTSPMSHCSFFCSGVQSCLYDVWQRVKR